MERLLKNLIFTNSDMPTNTVEEYMNSLPEATKIEFQKLRKLILKELPKEITETISYGILAFKLNGKFVIYLAGFKNHIGLYPVPSFPKDFEEKVKPYIKSKGTMQFQLKDPIPYDLVKVIVKYSLDANLKRTGKDKLY